MNSLSETTPVPEPHERSVFRLQVIFQNTTNLQANVSITYSSTSATYIENWRDCMGVLWDHVHRCCE